MRLCAFDTPIDFRGQGDVVQHGQLGQQFKFLKDQTDLAPELGDAATAQMRHVNAVDEDLARARLFFAKQ